MFRNLIIDRPLAVFDCETTGLSVREDRIVEISVLRVEVPGPNGQASDFKQVTRRFNPGIPIPAVATGVHHITDEMVADLPPFGAFLNELLPLLEGCDLCGFNLVKYDLPLLIWEMRRAGYDFPFAFSRIIDPLVIYRQHEAYDSQRLRSLSAAVADYCGRDHVGAHSASADVLATVEVLDEMIHRHGLSPRSRHLDMASIDPLFVDVERKFKRVEGYVVFCFGEHQGRRLIDVAHNHTSYLENFMMKGDFFHDVKMNVYQAIEYLHDFYRS